MIAFAYFVSLCLMCTNILFPAAAPRVIRCYKPHVPLTDVPADAPRFNLHCEWCNKIDIIIPDGYVLPPGCHANDGCIKVPREGYRHPLHIKPLALKVDKFNTKTGQVETVYSDSPARHLVTMRNAPAHAQIPTTIVSADKKGR